MVNEWHAFLKKHNGKGLTISELSKKYCNSILSRKIKINIDEGRYSSRKQAIAVAYKQVAKKSPTCGKVFSAKRKARL